MVDASDDRDLSAIGERHWLRELNARRVRLSDGTQTGNVLAALGFGALAIAAVLVLAWEDLPGADYVPPNGINASAPIPALAVVLGLIAAAAASAVVAWHAAGIRSLQRALAIIGCASVGALLGVVLLNIAVTGRAGADAAPAFAVDESAAAPVTIAAVVAILASLMALVSARSNRPVLRVVTSIGAAAPPIATCVAIAVAHGNEQLQVVGSRAAAGVVPAATMVQSVGSDDAAVVTVLLLAGSLAVIGVLVGAATAVHELIVERHRLAGAMSNPLVTRWRVSTVITSGVIVVLWLIGRTGGLPGGTDALPAFLKESAESWILATVFAIAGLAFLRSTEREPLRRVGLVAVVAAAAAIMSLGSVMSVVANVAALLDDSFFGAGWIHTVAIEWLPSWALWAQDWSNAVLPVTFGVLGIVLTIRRERSDRSAFLLAVAVISAVPGLLIVLAASDIDAGLAEFSPATPDQVMLVAVAIVGVGALAGRSVILPASTLRLTLAAGLVLFVATVLGASISERFFQLAIVLPTVAAVLLGAAHVRPNRVRSAVSVGCAVAFLLLVLSGLMIGSLTSRRIGIQELLVFLVMSAPLLLVELASGIPAEKRRAWSLSGRSLRLVPLVVAIPVSFLALGAVFAKRDSGSGPDLALLPLKVDLHSGWSGTQLEREDATEIYLQHDSDFIGAAHTAGEQDPCSEQALADVGVSLVPGSLEAVRPVAGLPTFIGQLEGGGEVVCAALADDDSTRDVVAVLPGGVTADVLAQIDDISFLTDG